MMAENKRCLMQRGEITHQDKSQCRDTPTQKMHREKWNRTPFINQLQKNTNVSTSNEISREGL